MTEYNYNELLKAQKELRYRLKKRAIKEVTNGIDNVYDPPHYRYDDIEVIDYIEQVTKDYPAKMAFAIGNAIKYISRAQRKNGKEDLEKALWYLQRAFDNWEDKR
ncbi:hypothetical protein BU637_08310 [Staphylococcus chromogenes]|nr:hypothetical protein BU637_08310 [Staphylococcus chromogenes]